MKPTYTKKGLALALDRAKTDISDMRTDMLFAGGHERYGAIDEYDLLIAGKDEAVYTAHYLKAMALLEAAAQEIALAKITVQYAEDE